MTKHQADPKACISAKQRKRAAKKKRPRCAAKGCKERLRAYMQFHCKHCHSKFCVKHRTAEDHRCQEKRADHYTTLLAKDRRKAKAADRKSEGAGPANGRRPAHASPPAITAY